MKVGLLEKRGDILYMYIYNVLLLAYLFPLLVLLRPSTVPSTNYIYTRIFKLYILDSQCKHFFNMKAFHPPTS